MQKYASSIPFLETITDFFKVYGIGEPLHPDLMCIRLQEQPDARLMHMPLYRSGFFRVIHFFDDNLQFTANEKKVPILSNCLCFSYPGKLESWERRGRLHGHVIYFSGLFAELDVTHTHFDEEYPFFSFDDELMIQLDHKEADELKMVSEEMIQEMYSSHSDKIGLLKKILPVYLYKIRRIYNTQINRLPAEIKANKALFNRFRKETDFYFRALANQQKMVMPSVSLIADLLGVNPNYLNGIIKGFSGKTASSYLQNKMVLEAKSYLLHSDLQVAEIAYRLGFENLPYFNRFFKKHTNCTPVAFRKQYER